MAWILECFFVKRALATEVFSANVTTGTGISYVAEKQLDDSVLVGMELDFIRVRNGLFTGNVTFTGNIIMGADAVIKTVGAGVGANGYVLDAAGIRGYSAVLGNTFNIPSDGSAPTFASGIINYTTFNVNTNAVIRTSATVGDGSASSAGVLMNNTGIYGCGASQLLVDANVKILASTGEIFAKLGTIGGWLIDATKIYNTNALISSTGYVSFGVTPPTSYGNNVGAWFGYSSVAKLSLYTDANRFFQYDGTDFILKGAAITAGTFQTSASANTGIKINSTAFAGYNGTVQTVNIATDGSGWFGLTGTRQISWTTEGVVTIASLTISGVLIMGAAGTIKTAGAGVGANGYVLDAAGFRGYSATLGTVFNIPTDGSAPTFASGIINYTTFNVNTNAVIRTSATVGDGSASSAGILINDTGFYACEANQLLSAANIKILIDGTGSFKGAISSGSTITGATIIGGMIQTATSGQRIVMNGPDNQFEIYSSAGLVGTIYGGTTYAYFHANENLGLSVPYASIGMLPGEIYYVGENYFANSINVGGLKFIVTNTGQITKINNVVTSGFIPISNGTHYEPRALTTSDLPLSSTFSWTGIQSFGNEFRLTNTVTYYETGSNSIAGKNAVYLNANSGSQTVTLTGMTTGQFLFIQNVNGANAMTICGVSVPVGKSMTARYSGSIWGTVLSA